MSLVTDEKRCWITWEEEEALLNFSQDLLDELGWEIGQELELEVIDDNTMIVRKAAESNEQ